MTKPSELVERLRKLAHAISYDSVLSRHGEASMLIETVHLIEALQRDLAERDGVLAECEQFLTQVERGAWTKGHQTETIARVRAVLETKE